MCIFLCDGSQSVAQLENQALRISLVTLKILPKVVITSVHAELAPMRASGCFGIVNLWEEKIPN